MNQNVDLMEKFFQISRLMHQSHHRSLDQCNASCRGQGRVLSLLKNHPQITQKELSSLLDIRSQSLGELLVRLERNGCIIRTSSEADHRVMNIKLTPMGMEAADRAEKNKQQSARMFDCLSTEEKSRLDDYLNRLMTEFENEAGETEISGHHDK